MQGLGFFFGIQIGFGKVYCDCGLGKSSGGSEELRLIGPKIVFDESPIPGFIGGSARGTAAVDLRVGGKLLDPTVQGDIRINDARASLPGGIATPRYVLVR